MNIPITLNGNKIILDARPEDSLMAVLRRHSCPSVKCGCSSGYCGSCAVLLNDNCVASCKIPVGIIRDCDIVTLDYFKRTKEYTTIVQGFELAGIKLCGYCDAGKIFSAYQLLKTNKNLSRNDISDQVKNLSPCCTDLATLTNGILLAIEIYDKGFEVVSKKFRKKANENKGNVK